MDFPTYVVIQKMYVFCIQNGCTPLHWACLNGHMDVAAMLIDQYGASPTAETKVRVRSDDAWM